MKDLLNIGRTPTDRIYAILMGFCWCSNLAFYLIPVVNRLGFSDPHNAAPLLLVFVSLFCVSVWKQSFRISDIFLYLAFVAIYYGSVFFYPNTATFIEEANDQIIIQSMPYLFFGLILNYERCRDALHLFSIAAIALNIVFFYLMSGMSKFEDSLGGEQMEFAYMFLPALLVVTYHALIDRKLIDIGATVVGALLLMFMGTRGPLVIYVFFIAAYFIFFVETRRPKLVKSAIALVAVVFYAFSDLIAMGLMAISASFGMSTRVFESMLSDNMIGLEASRGRDEIIMDLMNHLITDNPWVGYGLGSDKEYNGLFYSHNVIVEILFSFGFIAGGIMLVALAVLIWKAFKSCKSREERIFLMAMFCSGFMHVCFSSRFVWEPHFYMLIGVCIAINNKFKYEKYSNSSSSL